MAISSNWIKLATLIMAVGLLSSCATVRGWRGGNDANSGVETVEASAAMEAGTSTDALETELLRLVKHYTESIEADSANNQSRIIRKKPYYFKEYSNYQSQPDRDNITLTETESRTAPYVADVTLDKVRHATRLHHRREEARIDTTFLRDTGTETLSYELRNGRWTRVGSFFLAEKTEEQVDGEWKTVERTIQRTVEAEVPQQGWFGRSWSKFTGKD